MANVPAASEKIALTSGSSMAKNEPNASSRTIAAAMMPTSSDSCVDTWLTGLDRLAAEFDLEIAGPGALRDVDHVA